MKKLWVLLLFALASPAYAQLVPGAPVSASQLNTLFAGKQASSANLTTLSGVTPGAFGQTMLGTTTQGSAQTALGQMAQVDGNYFQITRMTTPASYSGTHAGLVFQQQDDENATAGQTNLPGAVFAFTSTGNGDVTGGTSHTFWPGLLATFAKQGDGSGQTITVESALGPVGVGGYNELGGYEGQLINLGSTNGYLSGVEMQVADGSSGTNYNTAMSAIVGRVARYNAGSRTSYNFLATSEGTAAVDAVLASSSGSWKNGVDLSHSTFSGNPFTSVGFSVSNAGLITSSSSINTTGTGYFFSQNGAVINRRADREFVGGMTVNDGAFPFTNLDWLSTLQAAWGLPVSYSDLGQLVVECENASYSSCGNAIVGAVQSKNNGSAGAYLEGLVGLSFCNNTVISSQTCEGVYGEAHRTLSTNSQAIAIELNAVAHVAGLTPSTSQQGLTVGIQDACGGGYTITLFACDAAMQVVANGAPFTVGLIFENGGVTPGYPAIEIPTANSIKFIDPSGDAAPIQGSFTTAAAGRINFTDNGILMAGHDGSPVAYFSPCAACVNWLSFGGTTTGLSPVINATGTDTNVGLAINTKGLGIVTVDAPLSATAYRVGSTSGASCSGAPSASFASTNGIVTHC
jgi:hypothetical protein